MVKETNYFWSKTIKQFFLRKKQIEEFDIKINGDDNSIIIANTAKFINCKIIITSHVNNITINDNAELDNCTIMIKTNHNQALVITKNTILKDKEIVLTNKDEEFII